MSLFIRAFTDKSLLFIKNSYNKLSLNEINSRKFLDFAQESTLVRAKNSLNNIENRTSKLSTKYEEGKKEENNKTFEHLISARRKECKRSVVIQVQSVDSHKDLYNYCCGFGGVKNMFHYVLPNNLNFFLVEFQDILSQKALLKSATHVSDSEIIPIHSQMLWFRTSSRNRTNKQSKDLPPLMTSRGCPSNSTLSEILLSKDNIGEQMQTLYNVLKLDEVGIRLRFITARQIETSFSSLISNLTVLPFGSSVNGFGKQGCDLDLVLYTENRKLENISSRLVYHAKTSPEEREQTKKFMEIIAFSLKDFVPGVKHVRKILLARVPIIKYEQAFTGIECDLSMTNMTAVYMSELLYLYGEIDDKVRPLIFTIRHWASCVGITNANPGGWITNFSLTILVLFYLQQKFILPSINTLKQSADASDIRIAHNTDADCTFLRDINKWPRYKNNNNINSNNNNSNNNNVLRDLLHDFFNFYANYDFTNNGISLRDGRSFNKPDNSPLYIRNPLEKTLNVSKNVSISEIVRFVNAIRNASMLMDEEKETCLRGLIDIFAEKQSKRKKYIFGRSSMSDNKLKISELFQIESDNNDNDSNYEIKQIEKKKKT